MSIVIGIPIGTSSGGGGGETPSAGTLTIASGETTANFNRTAGALKLVITNAGFAGGGTDDTATVNGINLFPGDKMELVAVLHASDNEYKTLPAVAVVTNGATIWWYEER